MKNGDCNIEITTRKIQLLSKEEYKRIQLDILVSIANICNAYRLNYYLAYGTLLGAIRHKGFIPWDDDIDICLERNNYESLISILKDPKIKKPEWLGVMDNSKEGYYLPFAKAVNLTTIAKQSDSIIQYGIWIDIFPVDTLPPGKIYRTFFVLKANILRDTLIAMTTDFHQDHIKKRLLKLLIRLCGNIFGIDNIYSYTINYIKKYKMNSSEYSACVLSPYGLKEIFKKNDLFQIAEVEFECKRFNAPKEWDIYLTKLYGDYMKIPAERKRTCHNVTAWKVL